MSQSSFTPEWLSLREPADTAARNADVLQALRRRFRNRRQLIICDLGSGTGAAVRAFADLLPEKQSWILIDNDKRNLATAKQILAAWAQDAKSTKNGLELRYRGRTISVETQLRDISNANFDWPDQTGLVTASALFDLTSRAWINRLVRSLQDKSLPLLATLTFNGQIGTDPKHPSDRAISASFRAHMRRDKGFGPAAGSNAAVILQRKLTEAGYRLVTGQSPWILTREHRALLNATAGGIAAAAKQMGVVPKSEIIAWNARFKRQASTLEIGHEDIFALPTTTPRTGAGRVP